MRCARHSLAPILLAILVGTGACGDGRSGGGESPPDADVSSDPADARPDAGPGEPAADARPDAGFDAPPVLVAPDTILIAQPPALTNQPAQFEFTSTVADATFACALDGGASVPCTSPFKPVLADGDHELRVAAIAPTGAIDPTPAYAAWRLDTVAPTSVIVTAPAALDNSATASFQFISEPDAVFSCAVDGAPFAPCTSPFHTDALAAGPHTFDVRAADLAGNVEAAPRHHAWNVDLDAPDTVIESGPGAFTTATDATFVFSSPDAGAGATFACTLDNLPAVACVSPWTLTDLGDAAHTVRIAVRDAAGNTDPTPAAFAWQVDTVAPTVTITSGPAGPSRDPKPAFRFTHSADVVATECRVTGATAFAPCSSPFTAPALADGDATFEVRVRDQVGLTASASRAFSIDTVAPVITITSAPSGIIADSQIDVAFTVSEPATTTCGLDSAPMAPCTDSFHADVLADGAHYLRVRAVDPAGNEVIARRTFRRDTLAPAVTISGPTGLTKFGVTGEAAPTFIVHVVDAGSSATRTCQIDSEPATACSYMFVAPTLADGDHVLTVTATDQLGHVGAASLAFTIDTQRIDIKLTSFPSAVSSNQHPSVGYVTTGAITDLRCRVDDGPWVECTGAPGLWTVAEPIADGTHQLAVAVSGPGIFASSYTPFFVVDTVP